MLLLDSHTLLWLLDDNPRLGPRARQAITSAQGVYVSAATIWELTIKTMLGKLSIPADFSKRLTAQGLALLSITAEHAEVTRQHTLRSITASIDRAREVLGYAPRYSSLDALHEALTWLAAHGQADVGGQGF